MKKVIKRTIKDQTKEIIESIEKVVFERDLDVQSIDAPKLPILIDNLQDKDKWEAYNEQMKQFGKDQSSKVAKDKADKKAKKMVDGKEVKYDW